MRVLNSSLALAVCLFLAGCDDSKTPLSDPAKSKADRSLAGLWRLQDADGNATYYHVGPAGGKLPGSVMRVASVTHSKDGSLQKPGHFLIFPSQLGGGAYLNMIVGEQPTHRLEEKGWQADVADTYLLLKYKLEGDALTIWAMDREAKKRAIQSGKIKGVIEKPQNGPERIRFADTTENLARFVAEAGDDLFSKEPLKLQRVK